MSDEEIALQIADRLVRALAPRRVVWFGSRAQGRGDRWSDYDFLVVADSDRPLIDRMTQAESAIRGISVPTDIIVLTPAEHAKYSTWKSSVVFEANRTGRVLFEVP